MELVEFTSPAGSPLTPDGPSGNDHEAQHKDLDEDMEVIESDSTTAREGVYQAWKYRNDDGDTANGAFAEIPSESIDAATEPEENSDAQHHCLGGIEDSGPCSPVSA